jgi:hypothetical protein
LPDLQAAADDLKALDRERLETLGMLIFQPGRYMQRVVEHLSFLPAGGEQWQRDIQLRIPKTDSTRRPKDGRFIVSLGMFRRYRFPDFVVKDASGNRLNLVTRRQHQHAVVMAHLRQYLDEGNWQKAGEMEELGVLYRQMASIITDIKGPCSHSPADVKESAEKLMRALKQPESEVERVSRLLEISSEALSLFTHYLCWVPAKPGDTISLSVAYTMADTVRVAGDRRKPTEEEELGWWTRERTRFYRSLGLVPVRYELRAPAHDHAGSYYLTIEPPEDSHVSMLDWGHDRTFDGNTFETDSAYVTCHIHNGEKLLGPAPAKEADEEEGEENSEAEKESIAGAKISAFLRGDPMDHAALIAVTLLNISLAYLAQRGEFDPNGGDSQQQWLLLAPTLVVALIAQHRRRYYSSATMWVRIGLWGYLGINALFGASVAFDISGGNKFDNLSSATMAVISLALFVLLVASSGLLERVTNSFFRSSVQEKENGDDTETVEGPGANAEEEEEEEAEVDKYLGIVRLYADATVTFMIIAVCLGIVGARAIDWGHRHHERQEAEKKFEGHDEHGEAGGHRTARTPRLTIPGDLGPASSDTSPTSATSPR